MILMLTGAGSKCTEPHLFMQMLHTLEKWLLQPDPAQVTWLHDHGSMLVETHSVQFVKGQMYDTDASRPARGFHLAVPSQHVPSLP